MLSQHTEAPAPTAAPAQSSSVDAPPSHDLKLAPALDIKLQTQDIKDFAAGYKLTFTEQKQQAVLEFTTECKELKKNLTIESKSYTMDVDALQNRTHKRLFLGNLKHPFHSRQFLRPLQNQKDSLLHQGEYGGENTGFISMTHTAFSRHYGLVIRPDDMHLLLLQGLARFITQYPDCFRESLVNFSNKKEVNIRNDNLTFDSPPTMWEFLPGAFVDRMQASLPKGIVDALLYQYSDSTPKDQQIKASVMMGTFSPYFNYTCQTSCFIPRFILTGTTADWEILQDLPTKLITELKLTPYKDTAKMETGAELLYRWLSRITPILKKMAYARNGEVDAAWWQSFYKYGGESGNTLVSGHLLKLYPFLFDQNTHKIYPNEHVLSRLISGQSSSKGVSLGEFPSDLIETDVTWECYGEPYLLKLKAGIFGVKINQDQKNLGTYSDWTLRHTEKLPYELEIDLYLEVAAIKCGSTPSALTNFIYALIQSDEFEPHLQCVFKNPKLMKRFFIHDEPLSDIDMNLKKYLYDFIDIVERIAELWPARDNKIISSVAITQIRDALDAGLRKVFNKSLPDDIGKRFTGLANRLNMSEGVKLNPNAVITAHIQTPFVNADQKHVKPVASTKVPMSSPLVTTGLHKQQPKSPLAQSMDDSISNAMLLWGIYPGT